MAIADIHQDIIQTHILTRLDGPTLAAASCTSSQLQSLCSDHKLWFNICSSYWPSTNDPLVTKIISSFASGHRSFFSDSFSCPLHRVNTTNSLTPTSQIISAVDLRYHNELVFSKVDLTDTTASDWFQSSPFRIDLLEHKEVVPSSIEFSGDDQEMQLNLQKHMTLSWILINPTQNRNGPLHDNDYVNCNIEITCGIKGVSGELYVSGVSLTVQDMDGKCLSGKDSMLILQGLTMAERQPSDGGEGLRARYDEYIERRRERKEKNERRERRLDMVCVASGVAFLMAFWSLALY
uniref:F-box protein At2g27310-like n=1 Tax=Tanacetum cinerariifolium TaxID=118510 RepID=A0A6L2NGR9_TANCI|nr:F-box protein At2g27310-like [Tanacetum cinerariifolium]